MADQTPSKIPNPRGKKPGERRLTPRSGPSSAMWYVLGFLLLLALGNAFFFSLQSGQTISYSDFKALVRDGKVAEVTVGEDRIRGLLKQAPEKGSRNFTVVPIEEPKAPKVEQWAVDGPSALVESGNGTWTWGTGWSDGSWRRRQAKTATTAATLTFSGTGAALMGDYDDKGGTAEVLVDGAAAGTINAREVTRTHESVYWHVTGLKPGKHTLEVRTKCDGPVTIAGAVLYGK